ncbi:MAG: RNase adapter RapZ [Corynebacteriales bacterium]|nr:RNase adapter RapZ [Mycobacteriales bacterium]
MDLVIVTGLSGAGRSTVARALENVGFYVVDNLPQTLLVPMAELAERAGDQTRRTAVVLDVRSRAFSTDVIGAMKHLHESGYEPQLIFLEASDEVLVRRFESVRRTHPLQGSGRLADGIAAERELLADARAGADVVLDTTQLNQNQLRARVEELFGVERDVPHFSVMSFGFKHGLPSDADLVLDMRFVKNPHWVPELRPLSGLDLAVSEYVFAQSGVSEFLDSYANVVAAMAPGYRREGKHHVMIAIGCTGGRHRSVASAEALAERLRTKGLSASTLHRDMGRE